MMRNLVIILLFFHFSFHAMGSEPPALDETCTNYILISGKTNVNNFKLSQSLNWNHEFFIAEEFIQDSHNETHHIHIPVRNFETDNPFMYDDFLDLLQENQYPVITIGIRKNIFSHMISSSSHLTSHINITIAGRTKTYEIPCVVTGCRDNVYYLSGKQKIKLTDFSLDPPVKSLGLIKVKNEVIINFGFSFMVN